MENIREIHKVCIDLIADLEKATETLKEVSWNIEQHIKPED